MEKNIPTRKPEWLRAKITRTPHTAEVTSMLRGRLLHTVCEEARCPNKSECFNKRTAAFMILGDICTRGCTFCAVSKGAPAPADAEEPKRVAAAVKELALNHAVITSVTRDDLPDGGAAQFAAVVRAIKDEIPVNTPIIEVLVPDFAGSGHALSAVIAASPDIINHNIETVPRLYPGVRPKAQYARSLELLKRVREIAPGIYTKSGIMLGLGETHDEVLDVFRDLRSVGCDMLTIGQYLAPSHKHHPVAAYIHPDEFARYKREAEAMGFLAVASAPLARSSYLAAGMFSLLREAKRT